MWVLLNNPWDEFERIIQQCSLSLGWIIVLLQFFRCFRIVVNSVSKDNIAYISLKLSLLVSRWTNSSIGLFDLIGQVFKTFFEKCSTKLGTFFGALRNWIFFYRVYHPLGRLIKHEAAILKFSTPVAMIATRELILERYYAILDQLERTHFYNHLVSNYTKQVYY